MIFRYLSAATLGAALSACSGHDAMMASTHVGQFEEHLADYEAEQQTHASEVDSASDLETILTLEEDHLARLVSHMAGMQHEASDMMSCMGSDTGETWRQAGAVIDNLTVLEDECIRHTSAMDTATDLDAVQVKEEAHQATMSELMDRMRKNASPMMKTMDSMECSHHDS